MKRNTYVDGSGNTIDQGFESKKPILILFFIIGTIGPLVLIGLIIFTAIQNNSCNNIYKEIKSAATQYLKDEIEMPEVEGEDVIVSLNKLYNGHYLNTFKTKNMRCAGEVKVTKYKNSYVHTLNLTNCDVCTTNTRYKGWSNELDYLPTDKPIVDVIPYYNYYERQVVTTDWSKYYDQEELDTKKSKYGVKLPTEENLNSMPKVPEEGEVVEVQKEDKTFYRYKDKKWKWYDIPGNYSGLFSEKPEGYANKDESTKTYTKWSEYSLTHPEEKSYREISKVSGYLFYYEDENGKKVYANNKNYSVPEDVDQTKYPSRENKYVEMYRYRDAKWRWYNGQARHYSGYSAEKPSLYKYRDDELTEETSYSAWEETSKVTNANKGYRVEETKIMTRFRYLYEILSDPVLQTPINKKEFVSKVGVTVPDFVQDENYKIEISYKFKYRKR